MDDLGVSPIGNLHILGCEFQLAAFAGGFGGFTGRK
jgi:hypothetical protein